MDRTVDSIYIDVYPSKKSIHTLVERFEQYLPSEEIEHLKTHFVSKYKRLKEVISNNIHSADPILHKCNKDISLVFKKVSEDVYTALVEMDDYVVSLHRGETERDYVGESLLANNIAQNIGRNFGGFSF